MTGLLWCLFAFSLGLLCLLLVRWIVEATNHRKPQYFWVWLGRVR